MLRASVKTLSGMHPVIVGNEILSCLPEILREYDVGKRVFVITDKNIAHLYEGNIAKILTSASIETHTCVIPSGEEYKNLEQVSYLWDWLAENRAERKDTILALGGGVIGDLAGWVAATYLRGMHLVQVPTTLLAQVDASIGGKTGINHPRAKNLIGSFYPPKLTFIDVSLLISLPERELRSGWAEVIKYAMIYDYSLYNYIANHLDDLKSKDIPKMLPVISRCAEIKLDIVTKDPKESGLRAILNYGHTLGHAIEAATGYSKYLHGEAVAIGMQAAGLIAKEMGLLDEESLQLQNELIAEFGLPRYAEGVEAASVREAIKLDKKIEGGKSRWILLRAIGKAEIRSDVPLDIVELAMREYIR